MKAGGYNSQNMALIEFLFLWLIYRVFLTTENIFTLYFLWGVGRYDDLLISILVILVRTVGCKPFLRVFVRDMTSLIGIRTCFSDFQFRNVIHYTTRTCKLTTVGISNRSPIKVPDLTQPYLTSVIVTGTNVSM